MKLRHKLLATAVAISGLAMAPQASAQIGGGASLGQIMDVGYNFCPRGWTQTNGQLLAISSNSALFSLLGTTYGGDGRTTFGLPDLRGRSIVNVGTLTGGQTYQWGRKTGQEFVTLDTTEMPNHSHQAGIRTSGAMPDTPSPASAYFAVQGGNAYNRTQPPGPIGNRPNFMGPDTVYVVPEGGSMPHENRPPTLAMYRCIALQGIYPSRN